MSAATNTPQVKGIVVSDEAFGSDTEADVFILEGVRQGVTVSSFPSRRDVWVFMLFEWAKGGSFNGNVQVLTGPPSRQVRYAPFTVAFTAGTSYQGHVLHVPNCRLPAPGQYTIEVWFWDGQGNEVLKGSRPFDVSEDKP